MKFSTKSKQFAGFFAFLLALWGFIGLTQGFGASIGDLGRDIKDNTKLTILQSATPAYFYELSEKDGDKRSKGGITTSIFEYRFLSADGGWIHGLDSSKEIGAAVIGGNFHIDRFLNLVAPDQVAYLKKKFPDSMEKFFNKATIGFYSSHNFDSQSFGYGLYSGLEFKF